MQVAYTVDHNTLCKLRSLWFQATRPASCRVLKPHYKPFCISSNTCLMTTNELFLDTQFLLECDDEDGDVKYYYTNPNMPLDYQLRPNQWNPNQLHPQLCALHRLSFTIHIWTVSSAQSTAKPQPPQHFHLEVRHYCSSTKLCAAASTIPAPRHLINTPSSPNKNFQLVHT